MTLTRRQMIGTSGVLAAPLLLAGCGFVPEHHGFRTLEAAQDAAELLVPELAR